MPENGIENGVYPKLRAVFGGDHDEPIHQCTQWMAWFCVPDF